VAADDGVMPQTKEAISHAQAARVPIIVAINKVDKPEANPERVKQQLAKEGLIVEEWGGKTISVEISAKDKKNIDELLEMILLLGDILELKSNPYVPAQGVILESRLDAQKGPVATVIIQLGTLTPGQAFICVGLWQSRPFRLNSASGERGWSFGPVEILASMMSPRLELFSRLCRVVTVPADSEFRIARAKKRNSRRGGGGSTNSEDLFNNIEKVRQRATVF
jgi:translation initiation factor IF-2